MSDFLPALGMSNAEALRANTSVAADVCGVGDRKGTISAGKDADLIAVAGDPLDDIACMQNVLAVFVKGDPIRLTPLTSPRTHKCLIVPGNLRSA